MFAKQEAGIPRKLASTIGIAIDPRRRSTSEESLALNVARLKTYKSRLILFPRKSGQHKKLDSSSDDVKTYSAEDAKVAKALSAVLPIKTGTGVKFGVSDIKTGEMPKSDGSVYAQLRRARSDARYVGVREKRAKAKAEAEESKKK